MYTGSNPVVASDGVGPSGPAPQRLTADVALRPLVKPVGAPVALGTVGGLRPCNTEEDPW
ncbi:hypothetical protein BN381_80354 [Candidatus Microthrix parvicella RN1]|uniref:Uncharacterized protein n=1 Tax=Candidatus Neomicrothrix parvicella RN1 TaxID=1229780 RepID=R4Z4K9_9ACTN|nr:hypothetical protein BN381_80354 [Candidatus Microthrix parvicella RN1]